MVLTKSISLLAILSQDVIIDDDCGVHERDDPPGTAIWEPVRVLSTVSRLDHHAHETCWARSCVLAINVLFRHANKPLVCKLHC